MSDDIYAPARRVTQIFRYATEIEDLVTAEGILLAMDCPATAANVWKVIGKLEALAVLETNGVSAITEHWESMARPVVHSESLGCTKAVEWPSLHYWAVTSDNVIKCLRCGYCEQI